MMLLLPGLFSVDGAEIVALANLKYNTLMSSKDVAQSAYNMCGRLRDEPVLKALLKSRLIVRGFAIG